MAEQDTDILLALLSSLLASPVDDPSTLLDALVEADGDVERAATLLNSRPSASAGTPRGVKRKRNAGLDGWLGTGDPKDARKRDSSPVDASTSTPRKRPVLAPGPKHTADLPSPGSSPRKVKTVTQQEFMSLLRPPNSSEAKPQGPPKFPPLTLTTPALVAKHTPCTMHLSILPPELASR